MADAHRNHKAEAQAVRATKLIAAYEQRRPDISDADFLATAKLMFTKAAWWNLLAGAAKISPPSLETRGMVIALLQARVDEPDPFKGFPT